MGIFQTQKTACESQGTSRLLSEAHAGAEEENLINVSFIGGRVKYFYEKWSKIIDGKFVLSCISGYKISIIKDIYSLNNTQFYHNTIDGKEFSYLQLATDELL